MSLLTDLEGLLVTNPTNIRYLTDFLGASPTEREAYILLTHSHLYFFTNSLYLEKAKQLLPNPYIQSGDSPLHIEVLEISRTMSFTKHFKKVIDSLYPERSQRTQTLKIGIEETNITVAEHTKLQSELADVNLIPASGRIEEFRKIKKTHEIAYIKKAAHITDQCFDFILKKIKLGVAESEIAWEIETFFRKNRAESSFSPIVAFDKNSSQPHYSPSANYELRTNNLILLDFGARVNGYCADMTRVVFLGEPTEQQKKAYDVLKNAQEQILNALQNGERSGAVLDKKCRELIEQSGFPPYPHSLGHAVGLDIHEAPRLSIYQDATLEPGMVVTIEPGIYLEGKFGIRIEDLILISEKGIEILSKSSKQLQIL